MNIPKVLNSEEVYKGKIISIRKDTLTRGDGKSFIRETAISNDAVAVVAMDEQRRILLIRQYRHVTIRLQYYRIVTILEGGRNGKPEHSPHL